jgi:hypothetical protein
VPTTSSLAAESCTTKAGICTRRKSSDLTITINRSDLEQVMLGKKTFDAQIAEALQRPTVSVLRKLAAIIASLTHAWKSCPA